MHAANHAEYAEYRTAIVNEPRNRSEPAKLPSERACGLRRRAAARVGPCYRKRLHVAPVARGDVRARPRLRLFSETDGPEPDGVGARRLQFRVRTRQRSGVRPPGRAVHAENSGDAAVAGAGQPAAAAHRLQRLHAVLLRLPARRGRAETLRRSGCEGSQDTSGKNVPAGARLLPAWARAAAPRTDARDARPRSVGRTLRNDQRRRAVALLDRRVMGGRSLAGAESAHARR